MTISGQNFEVYQGDNKEIIITVRDDNENIIDLTGYSVVWCVHNQRVTDIIFQKTTSLGEEITIPNPTSGEIIITLEGLDTHILTPKNYGHQCEIQDQFGNHATVTTGYMKILKSITHHVL